MRASTKFQSHRVHPQSSGTTSRELGFPGRQGEHERAALDDSTYVAYYDGDLFRAYHSDVADIVSQLVERASSR
jgi:hypothetical protein